MVEEPLNARKEELYVESCKWCKDMIDREAGSFRL